MKDFEVLACVGLTQYERQTLIALLKRGVADAATLCTDGDVPSSKIYSATEKLAKLGLISVQRSRPRQFAAHSVEDVVGRISEIVHSQAEARAEEAAGLVAAIKRAQGADQPASAFTDVAMGAYQHVQRHLTLLASASSEIVSYLESPDLDAIRKAKAEGVNVLRSVRKNLESRGIAHRIVFGFGPRDATGLKEFLREFRAELRSTTGVRYAGLLGHPFHVVDRETVILSLDNPFLSERRFGSLMMRSKELADPLARGFEGLWLKSMKSLQEVDFDPRVRFNRDV
ncbi:MAG: hypothetical protein JST30_12560 [Armatimonadetes bacterium]|nr:hypothetical protein [Armatimonadota bacterium]